MSKKKKQINFDLSKLTLTELITLYNEVNGFKTFIKEAKIEDN